LMVGERLGAEDCKNQGNAAAQNPIGKCAAESRVCWNMRYCLSFTIFSRILSAVG